MEKGTQAGQNEATNMFMTRREIENNTKTEDAASWTQASVRGRCHIEDGWRMCEEDEGSGVSEEPEGQ
ncbi:hypothetical protein V496_06377 [Pseudogymnoascus sp. VKM F-4515 (FW-2607)]|nr:hypothetical protein V496_06377 [Pseudogymnoascus sp. VKM F-4515 (FW-2607)]KFY68799.1 hypothetical protein V498_10564 [Pseudogymnoascus sp. VKM F-4517 (FW-2822)]